MTQIMIDVSRDAIDWYLAEAAKRKTTFQALMREVLELPPRAVVPQGEDNPYGGGDGFPQGGDA